MMTKEKPIIFSGPSIPAILNLKPNVWPPEPIDPGGGRVGYTEDGVMQLDLCVETREEALDMIERQKVVAVAKK